MGYKVYIQYSDRDLDDHEDSGVTDVSSAITLFEKFDWKKEEKNIEERKFYRLTSTKPALIIKKDDQAELTIIRLERDEFEVIYENNNKVSELIIDENSNNISVQDCIRYFYENKLEVLFDPGEEMVASTPLTIGRYKPWAPIAWLTIPGFAFIFVGFILLSIIIPGILNWTFFILPLVFIVLGILPLIFAYQYIRLPKVDSLSYDQNKKEITIQYRSGLSAKIYKKDIIQCVCVYNDSGKDMFAGLFSVTLTDIQNEQYYLTCLSFELDMIRELLQQLGINYYFINTRLPGINKKIFPKVPGTGQKNAEMNLSELEESYQEKSDKALLQIIENPENYEPEAVTTAKKIIEGRKIL